MPMTRHYVHCTTNPQHFPGQRCELVITVALRQMVADGVKCWISHNGVYQFKHVDPKYFVSVNYFVQPEQTSLLMTDYLGDEYVPDV
jgi:RNA:NAD 2'-phosphotransferase (TPT1/KptA family)